MLFVTAWPVKDGRGQPHRDLGQTSFQPEAPFRVQPLGLQECFELVALQRVG